MKTTIELPDDLVKQVKLRALHDGRKLKDTVAELLLKGLAAPMVETRRAHQSPLTFDESTGLPLIRGRRTTRPGEQLTPGEVAGILLQQEVDWHHEAG